MPPCTVCARAGAASPCTCSSATYCGAACQRAHWAAHKPVCKAIRADEARDTGWKATSCDACAAALVSVGHRCSYCFSVEYCNAACQLAHWTREHKAVCRAVGKASFARKKALAAAGDTASIYNLALAFEKGTGVAVDEEIAFKWFSVAAESHDADAQYNLARRFEKGIGCEVDKGAVIVWYLRASLAGHRCAQWALACFLETAEGIYQDCKGARTWYHRAAEAGLTVSQVYLAGVYKDGSERLGIAADLREAIKWYRLAAEGRGG